MSVITNVVLCILILIIMMVIIIALINITIIVFNFIIHLSRYTVLTVETVQGIRADNR